MFRAALSALWPLDQPEHPRTPDSDSRSKVFAEIQAELDAYVDAAHAQVAVMSADERRQLAAAGRTRVFFPEAFASREAERAYRLERLRELAAITQDNAEKQLAAAAARQARPDQRECRLAVCC